MLVVAGGGAKRIGAALVLAGLLLGALAGPSSASAAGRVTLSGTTSELVAQHPKLGQARGETGFAVALRLRHRRELDRLVEAVSDPASPRYADYLSPERFRQRFSPTRVDVEAVRTWLQRQGLEVTGASSNRTLLSVSGGASQVERAFQTRLDLYRVRGEPRRAPSAPVSVPGRLHRIILSVPGLQESPYTPAVAGPAPANRTARPCSSYYGEKIATKQPGAYGSKRPWAVCGYEPDQFQSAYGVRDAIASGLDGSGQTVAIVDAFKSPTLRDDLNEFSSRHGLPPAKLEVTRFQGCQVQCSAQDQQGWYGEQTLDVESVHTMAPGAKIHFIGGYDADQGLLEAINWAVDHRVARIITNSYGAPDPLNSAADIRAEEQIHKQAIAQGIGLYFSTGDHGDNRAEFGFVSTDYPASSPRVTAMGGNTLAIGPLDNFRFETGWGLRAVNKTAGRWTPDPPGRFQSGSGGGTTKLFVQPHYQQGVVPPRLVTLYGGRGRVLPDISMAGDPSTGTLVGQTQRFPDGTVRYNEYAIGGTSLASPLFAGYMALSDQAAGFPHGFVNPALYELYGSKALRDVRPVPGPIAQVVHVFVNGVNRQEGMETVLLTGDLDSSLLTTRGFDNVTGLGSPRGIRLLRALRTR